MAISWAVEPDIAGAAGASPDAHGIEIAVISSQALDALKPEAVAATVHDNRPDGDEGAPVRASQAAEISESKPAEVVLKAIVQSKPDPSPQPTDLQLTVAEIKPAELREADRPAEAPPAPDVIAVAATAASMTTGSVRAMSSEQAPAQPKAAAAAASPGAVQHYARDVVDVLVKARPKSDSGRARGTVKVTFAVSDAGRPEAVRITSSSGNPRLDDLAISAIRKAAFPPPPPGITLAQRTYEIPYHFR